MKTENALDPHSLYRMGSVYLHHVDGSKMNQEKLRQDAIEEMMRVHHKRVENFVKEIEDYLASDQYKEAKERALIHAYRNMDDEPRGFTDERHEGRHTGEMSASEWGE
jgi:hypothetical protein